jgi:hypothetical protein
MKDKPTANVSGRQHARTLALRMATWGYVRPEEQTVGDRGRFAATAANTAAKPLDNTGPE